MKGPESIIEQELTPEVISRYVSLMMIKPENEITDELNRAGANPGKSLLYEAILKNYGFTVEHLTQTLSEKEIKMIYPDIDSWDLQIREAMLAHMNSKEVQVLLIYGDNISAPKGVLNQILELRGMETDPTKSRPGSFRHTFHSKRIENGEVKDVKPEPSGYWRNGLHSPKSPNELMVDLEAFGLRKHAEEITHKYVSG